MCLNARLALHLGVAAQAEIQSKIFKRLVSGGVNVGLIGSTCNRHTLVSARLRIFPVKRRTRGTSSPVPMPKNVSFHGRSRNQGLPNVARHVCQNDARYFT